MKFSNNFHSSIFSEKFSFRVVQVQHAGLWVAAKAIADPLGLLVGFLVSATVYPIAGGVSGLISGAITDGVMVWLLQGSGELEGNK